MRILVTGSCGYKGSVLVPKLLKAGHEVTGFDTQWFGENLQPHQNLKLIKGDIRDDVPLSGIDLIIHLAGIANDPCGELDAKLTWEVNVLGTMRLADAAVKAGVKRFIFASSASVYGIKGNEPVVETTSLEPVSDYNKTKMVGERCLLSYKDKMLIQIVRPATVCGVSPRMRLDVVVNMLTAQALSKGEITAHCGTHGAELMRPHVHIEDITDLYCWLVDHPEVEGIFNAGFDNQSVGQTAALINGVVPSKINISVVQDKRSYRVDSSKLLAAGFKPERGVVDAISDIAKAWGISVNESPKCYNLQWMRDHGLVSE